MNNSSHTWTEYWNADGDFWLDPIWSINADIFLSKTPNLVCLSKNDTVLNIGCGPGYIEKNLASKVQSIFSVDVAQTCVNLCAARCSSLENVDTALLGRDYTNLSKYTGDRTFSLFLASSVVQYYQNFEEIKLLVESAAVISKPGARMLVSDIPMTQNFIKFCRDAILSVNQAVHFGYSKELAKSAYRRWFGQSKYRNFSSISKELRFNSSDLRDLRNQLSFETIVIQDYLSVYANRPSLLIQF